MQRVTIGWIAWDMTASASFVGLIAFVSYAPSIVTGPFFGVLVDRIRVKRAAMATQVVLLLLAFVLFATYAQNLLTPALLAVFSGLSGIVSSAYNPIRMSLAPRLVDQKAVASVITLGAINFNLARLTGPAIGGWMIAVWGVGPSLLVQSFLYLPFIFAISFLKPRPRSHRPGPVEPFMQAMAAGIRYVRHHDLTRRAILITAAFAFVIRGVLEILPVLADGVFDKGASGLGLLTSAAGFGALLAGVGKAFLPSQIVGRLPLPALISAVIGVALVPVVGQSTSWELTLVLIAILGFTTSLTAISMQTAIQLGLDDDFRGRVMSIWVMLGIGASAAGAVVLGSLADQIGFGLALGLGGGVCLVLLGWLLFVIWRDA